MDTFYNYLKKRLDESLPGKSAQLKMSPKPNGDRYSISHMVKNIRVNGVLILLHSTLNDVKELLLTLRTNTLPTHKGQISFPGGKSDEDETIIETALREANEEVGLNSNEVHILGTLTGLYLPNSNNYIYPVVGFIDHRPKLTLNPSEVDEAFFVQIDTLLKSDNLKIKDWNIRGNTYKVPYWDIHPSTPLWGATAMILSEFLSLYRDFKQTDAINQKHS